MTSQLSIEMGQCWEDDRKAFECALRDGLEIPDGTLTKGG
jgi:hypothetical protein